MLPIWLESTVFFWGVFFPPPCPPPFPFGTHWVSLSCSFDDAHRLRRRTTKRHCAAANFCARVSVRRRFLSLFWVGEEMVLEKHLHMTWTSTGSGVQLII